jgi:CheY-like chemotaxis protein
LNWLIAEDEADIRNLVSMMCTVWGHTPITFETGQKVWDWMDKIEAGETPGPMPGFALMDIRMPGRRGNEIALRMRTLAPLKNIPIVLMTAFALSDEEMKNMRDEYGVDHIINKPLPDFDKLRNMLNDVIEKKAASVPKEVESVPPKPATPEQPTRPSAGASTTPTSTPAQPEQKPSSPTTSDIPPKPAQLAVKPEQKPVPPVTDQKPGVSNTPKTDGTGDKKP